MKKMVSMGSLAVLFLAVLMSFGGCAVSGGYAFMGAKYEKRVEKTFETGAGGTFALKSELGSVTVQSHAGDTVKIIATLKSNEEEWFDRFDITFETEGNNVDVLGEWKDRTSWRRVRMGIHYEIQVPREYSLKIRTAGGSISVDDLQGEANLRTSGGSISAGKVQGSVVAQTSGGSIRLEGSDGPADLSTSGGGITVGEVNGPVNARTSGGSIQLRGVSGNVNARTSGGSIHADLKSQISEPAEFRTSGGSIRLAIDPSFKADIDAETSGGRVSCDLPVTIHGTAKKTSLNGTLNGGGPRVSLKTSGGSIYISEL